MIAHRTFQSAVEALQRGNRSGGYSLLRQVLLDDPSYTPAWLRMSGLVSSAQQQRECFEQVLLLDPGCALAQEGLQLLRLRETLASTPTPLPQHASAALRGLSAFLISQRFVTRARLEQALAEYRPPHDGAGDEALLGDILIQRGWLPTTTLATTLVLQPDEPPPAPSAHPAAPRRLADEPAADRRITHEQLALVLDGQAHLYRPGTLLMLGEVLLRGGFVARDVVLGALDRQHHELMARLSSVAAPE